MSVRIGHNAAIAPANNDFAKIERATLPERSSLSSGLATNSGDSWYWTRRMRCFPGINSDGATLNCEGPDLDAKFWDKT